MTVPNQAAFVQNMDRCSEWAEEICFFKIQSADSPHKMSVYSDITADVFGEDLHAFTDLFREKVQVNTSSEYLT